MWVLILMAWLDKDAALTSIPGFPSQADCTRAGAQVVTDIGPVFSLGKPIRYSCVQKTASSAVPPVNSVPTGSSGKTGTE